MTPKQFHEIYYPYSLKAALRLGYDAEEILAWWSWETAYATNHTCTYNNMGGIKWINGKSPYQDNVRGGYAMYNSLDRFVDDYVRVMSLSFYKGIAAAQETPQFEDDVIAHNDSPYSEADYDVKEILRRIKEFKSFSGVVAPDGAFTVPTTIDDSNITLLAQIGLAFLGLNVLVQQFKK